MNLTNNQPDFGQFYLYDKDLYEVKYQFLIKKRQDVGLKHFYQDPKAFIEYSNDMKDVCKNTEDCNPGKKRKVLIVFDDMIANMSSNKKLHPVVIDLFISGPKLNISLVFITQQLFSLPKNVRLNTTQFFIMKIPKTQEVQQTAIDH